MKVQKLYKVFTFLCAVVTLQATSLFAQENFTPTPLGGPDGSEKINTTYGGGITPPTPGGSGCATEAYGGWVKVYDASSWTGNASPQSEAELDLMEQQIARPENFIRSYWVNELEDTQHAEEDVFITVEGWIRVTRSNYYTLQLDGDDAIDFSLNGYNVLSWYGEHASDDLTNAENDNDGHIRSFRWYYPTDDYNYHLRLHNNNGPFMFGVYRGSDYIRSITYEKLVCITDVSPNPAQENDIATIHGRGFFGSTQYDSVWVDGVLATITNATPNELTIILPDGVVGEDLPVVVKSYGQTDDTTIDIEGDNWSVIVSKDSYPVFDGSSTYYSIALTGSPYDGSNFLSLYNAETSINYGRFLSRYDESTSGNLNIGFGSFMSASTTSYFERGVGYLTYVSNRPNDPSQSFDVVLSQDLGNVAVEDFTFSVSYTLSNESGMPDTDRIGSGFNDGWNLLSNPYKEILYWNADGNGGIIGWDLSDSIDRTIYHLNSRTHRYESWNGMDGTWDGSRKGAILPFEGFWVKASGTVSPSLKIDDPVAATSQPEGVYLLKGAVMPKITLSIQGEEELLADKALVLFNDEASESFDNLDAYKLKAVAGDYVSLYSIEAGVPLEINTKPLFESTTNEFAFGLTYSKAGQYEVAVEQLQGIPAGFEVRLTDVATGKVYELDNNTRFVVDLDASSAQQLDPRGNILQNETVSNTRFVLEVVSSNMTNVEEESLLPSEVSLSQNYPNPFNPSTQISYTLNDQGMVSLEVYNLNGQKVATLVNSTQSAGSYNVSFDATYLPSGVYMYRLNANGQSVVKKMTLVK